MEHLVAINESVFSPALALEWSSFVNCPKRLETMGSFLEHQLRKHKSQTILDAGMGVGCESIYLKERGFTIVSNEIDETMIEIAQQFATNAGTRLQIISEDWRKLSSSPGYGAIFLMGNSLCLTEPAGDIKAVLKSFYQSLHVGGTFIVDERNFPYIIQNRASILAGDFRYSGKYIYCGSSIKGIPTSISEKEIVFGYFKNSKLLGQLRMYPFRKGELTELLRDAGFKNIRVFSDFKPGYDTESDFFIYTANK